MTSTYFPLLQFIENSIPALRSKENYLGKITETNLASAIN